MRGRGSTEALFAAHRQPFTAFGAPALEHQPAVFRTHTNQKAVCPPAMPRIRLKRALPLHDVPSERDRTANVSEGVPRVSIQCDCVRVDVLSEALVRPARSCVFGLSPKFSTPVEKTVENRAALLAR